MASSPVFSRRRFIGGLGVVAMAGLAETAFGGDANGASAQATASKPSRPQDYLLDPGLIHLNTASLGATPRKVLDSTMAAWRKLESNPVPMAYAHGPGEDSVLADAERVRGVAAGFLGCDADEILITHGTTDGMNIVAQGLRWNAGDRVLTTDQEHEGGNLCWQYTARRHGVAIDAIAIVPGEHDPEAILRRFADAIVPATRVISVSHVTTSTGLRMPIAGIAALARKRGILCIVDGAQAAGGIAVDVKALGCHAYATSGHKWLMGPKGTGILYVSREASEAIAPIPWQESHLYGAQSAGVSPLTLAVGLGTAIGLIQSIGIASVESHDLALRDRAYAGLMGIKGIRMASPPPGPQATPLIACILPDAIDSVALRKAMLSKHRINVKSAEKRWFNGFRLSPHILNTESEIDQVLRALREELA